ncbi:MAG: ATP-dependent helicase [Eubacteriales bacterium]|nr:ATP-dependent helicase [Eubacteriales bacterium]
MAALVANEAQELAISTINGPVLIVACPGAGKTTTVIRRIHSMVESGVDPKTILMVTFSKAAALEMWHKYEKMFGKNPGVAFQTIHSLCLHILVDEGKFTQSDILTEHEKFEQLFGLVQHYSRDGGDLWDLTMSISTELGVVKNNFYQIGVYKPTSCEASVFNEVVAGYEEWKRYNRRIDFDDMLVTCLELLQNDPDVRVRWEERFHYIQCDEYQDTNAVQRDILYTLSGKYRNLCVVGDDDQSIYRFRGARPEIMLRFSKDFPDAKLIMMSTNYRSSEAVVAHADRLIKHNKKRFDKEFISFRATQGVKGRVSYIKTKGKKDEMKQLLNTIRACNNRGLPYSKMAVLFRTNQQASLLITTMAREQIPFNALDSVKSIYDGWMFRDIRIYAELSAGIWKDQMDYSRKLLTILNHPNRYFDYTRFRNADYSLEGFANAIRPLLSEKEWKYEAAMKKINTWMRNFGPGKISMDDAPGKLFDALTARGSIRYDKYVVETAKFRNQDPEDYKAEYDELKTEAAEFPTIRAWLAHADKTIAILRNANKEKNKDGVVLSTMHRSKGLEWPTVFIIDCNQRVTPHKDSMYTCEGLEEERRLFYVGMTRAKDQLYVYCSGEESIFIDEADLETDEELRKTHAVPKYLPGKVVYHKRFGEGKIVSYGADKVQVRFDGEVRAFRFPDVFNDGIMRYA